MNASKSHDLPYQTQAALHKFEIKVILRHVKPLNLLLFLFKLSHFFSQPCLKLVVPDFYNVFLILYILFFNWWKFLDFIVFDMLWKVSLVFWYFSQVRLERRTFLKRLYGSFYIDEVWKVQFLSWTADNFCH